MADLWTIAGAIGGGLAALVATVTLAYMIIMDRRRAMPVLRLEIERTAPPSIVIRVSSYPAADWLLEEVTAVSPAMTIAARTDEKMDNRIVLRPPLAIERVGGLIRLYAPDEVLSVSGRRVRLKCGLVNMDRAKRHVMAEGWVGN